MTHDQKKPSFIFTCAVSPPAMKNAMKANKENMNPQEKEALHEKM